METQVITPEELQKIQTLQSHRDKLTIDFGYVEFQIQELELQKETLIESLSKLKAEELQVGSEIQEKYGKVNIDLTTGEFTPLN